MDGPGTCSPGTFWKSWCSHHDVGISVADPGSEKRGAPGVLRACPQDFFVNFGQFRGLFKVFAEKSTATAPPLAGSATAFWGQKNNINPLSVIHFHRNHLTKNILTQR